MKAWLFVLLLCAVFVLLLRVVPAQDQDYYVRAYEHHSYIIEHDGRQLTATCRETLAWLDGLDKPGRPMTEHDCVYMHSLIGQHIRPESMWQQDKELRFEPWVGYDTAQTADILDITAEAPIGSPLRGSSPKTSLEILKTLHWIQNTLADEEGETLYFNKDGKDDTRINLLPDVNGCEVTFVYATRSDWKETYHTRQQINLGALDPESLSIETATHDVMGPVSIVTVYTTDKVPKVRLTVNDRNWQSAMTVPSTDLLWELPSPYAARFVKALHQAVTLCGGKPSSF
ncbi:MAG: hypothetical protein ACRD4S_04045 [Candidatus Acidiferrales bacterium]